MLPKDADRFFWKEIQPLMERGIPIEDASLIVLFTNYPMADLSNLKSSCSIKHPFSLYPTLSKIFAKHGFWNLAFEAANLSPKDCKASTFLELCKIALSKNDLDNAWLAQSNAQKVSTWGEEECLLKILLHEIESSPDLEMALEKIDNHLIHLLEINREYGLLSLITAAKKAIDMQNEELAKKITELADKERISRDFNRMRNYANDVIPYKVIAHYCLNLKQYELSEYFARKVNTDLWWYLSRIITSKLADGIIDYCLIDEFYMSNRLTTDLVVQIVSAHLIQDKIDEAKLFIFRYLENIDQHTRDSLISQLEEPLKLKNLTVKNWLKQSPEYAKYYSISDALEDENLPFLLQNKINTEKALKIYLRHVESPGVLDLLVNVACQEDNFFTTIKLCIKGIGLALNIESLRGQAKQALLKISMTRYEYTYYSQLRIQALNELVTRVEKCNEVQKIIEEIIANDSHEVMQRAALNFHDNYNGKPQEIFNEFINTRMLDKLISTLNSKSSQQTLFYLLNRKKEKMNIYDSILEKSLPFIFKSIDDALTKENKPMEDLTIADIGELLLILGFIGESTSNSEIYSQIEKKIYLVLNQKENMATYHETNIFNNNTYYAINAFRILNRNKTLQITEESRHLLEKFIEKWQSQNKKKTYLELMYSLKKNIEEYCNKIKLKYDALLDVVNSDEKAVETRVLALRELCAYALPDHNCNYEVKYQKQAWDFLDKLKSKDLPDLVEKEINRIYSWK